ncbi:TATA-binding protein-associated factor Mot1p [Trichomonascus vanleenenianus]|uniref:DNA-binding ATPase n=1 Tax=Trichomonascus vanleenenianus TaxID=2268995 RepID=UPI003ECB0990
MSRLDRLVLLLDTGSSSFVRNTAADQLADVQKNHPEDLLNLLSRVFPYLKSIKWDTRIASARAIGGIVANAARWDPNEDDPKIEELEEEVKPDPDVKSEPMDVDIKRENDDDTLRNGNSFNEPDDRLSFAKLDLTNVLKNGKKLLGSAGKEYDDPFADLDPVEKLRRQKSSLKKTLGLGSEYVDDDLLNDADVASAIKTRSSSPAPPTQVPTPPATGTTTSTTNNNNSSDSKPDLEPTKSQSPPPQQSQPQPTPAQNARMRALAKRRAKYDAKNASNKVRIVDLSSSSASRKMDKEQPGLAAPPKEAKEEFDITAQGHNDKVVVEHKAPPISQLVAKSASAGRMWPFEGLCELLMVDLFDQSWETRHGAALGLREVIKVHGAGAGRIMGKTRSENDKLNSQWLEDLACRLCCIFALDRFGDFVSDQVVAPVRESSAQTLGALLLHLPEPLIFSTFDTLRRLVLQKDVGLEFPLWEACHGGMLGLRYLVSVRTDVLVSDVKYFDGLIECILHGLQQSDDDVQAMSAAALIPIASQFVSQRTEFIGNLLDVIWDCLGDLKDDLSASIGNVMDLLAKLCGFPVVLEIMRESSRTEPNRSLIQLVPRLYPFLRHSISNVRKAVLRAIETFLDMEGTAAREWITGRMLRLIFQNLLVEQNQSVLELSLQVWNKVLDVLVRNNDRFDVIFGNHITPLMTLIMTPIGAARHCYKMDPKLFIRPSGATYGPLENEKKRKRAKSLDNSTSSIPASLHVNIDNPMFLGDVMLVGYSVFLRTKIAGAQGLGRAISLLSNEQLEELKEPLSEYLNSSFSTQRLTAALILEEYGKNSGSNPNKEFALHFKDQLMKLLTTDVEPMYRDLTPYLKAVRTQCQALFSVFVDNAKLSRSKLPQIAVVVQGEADAGPDAFSLETAEKIAYETYDKLKKGLSTSYRITASQSLSDAHRNLAHAIDEAKDARTCRQVSILASAAAAYMSMVELPKKLNPIIRSLMESVKAEENIELQTRTSASVANMVVRFLDEGKGNAADKVVKNLSAFLCVDTSEVPEFHPNERFEDIILSLRKEESRSDAADEALHQRMVRAAKIKRQGADMALRELSKIYGPELFSKVPKLKQCMLSALEYLKPESSLPEDIKDPNNTVGQDIIDGLSTIRALLPHLHTDLHSQFLPHFPLIQQTLKSQYSVLRYTAAKCYATICKVMPVEGISSLVENILPMVNNALDLHSRQGAIECIYHLSATMGVDILPYVVFLIVPVLGRMSDADRDVRLIATTTFASIIKLVPLESGIPDPPGMSQKLLEGRDREREFISQMLDVSKIKAFKLPVAIKADLRKYQQEGVNWLAFLNKYHLHGVLCDDMGLGKTLQTICIVASDHHLRAEEHAKTGSPETRRLPSLVVCPPSLTGHWQHELKTYAPFINVLVYVGSPSVRQVYSNKFMKYDMVVTSYDIARNDATLIAAQNWNYCVLDEGHIIKNAASKLTRAVKTFNANHRLILTGTPIQNNVLELWSLFDFLMPGFLGTEKVFNERFAKPIAASRNSKSSDKDQEAGALALEALHKQVLPFLLRRLKEDVLSDLPPKIIQDYYCELSELQKRLYENFAKKQKTTVAHDVADPKNKEKKQHIFQALQYMRKLCNHPALVLNPKHPQYEKVMRDLQARKQSLRDITHAPKLQALQTLLNDCGIGLPTATGSASQLTTGVTSQHRALIFCQLKDMLDMVENDLLKTLMPNVSYMRLDGSTEAKKRHDIVQQFNGDPSIDVLLLTTHVGGLGLNLTGADTVIFVEHDWNPMNDLQAMDRAHRIGQKKVVNVYRLITRNTLEEKIMGLQKFKLNIASTIINQQNSGLASMDTDQLLDLFDVPDVEALSQNAGTAAAEEETGLDATGQLKGPGSKAITEIGELWDEKEYEEEYNLDSFIQGLRE